MENLEKMVQIRTSNHTLSKVIDDSIVMIKRCFDLYSTNSIAFSFNGGKDSTVLLHLLRMAIADYEGSQFSDISVIYFEDSDNFEEMEEFISSTCEQYSIEMLRFSCSYRDGLEQLLSQKAISAVFIGTRFGDPHADNLESFSPSSPGWPPFMRVHPILRWNYCDIWNFLLELKIPFCSLYSQGYTSLGSKHNTQKNPLLYDGRVYFPAWQLYDGTKERIGRDQNEAEESSKLISTNSLGLLLLTNGVWLSETLENTLNEQIDEARAKENGVEPNSSNDWFRIVYSRALQQRGTEKWIELLRHELVSFMEVGVNRIVVWSDVEIAEDVIEAVNQVAAFQPSHSCASKISRVVVSSMVSRFVIEDWVIPGNIAGGTILCQYQTAESSVYGILIGPILLLSHKVPLDVARDISVAIDTFAQSSNSNPKSIV